MARNYECSECLHIQAVGVIDNGLGGFADPHAICNSCGAVGRFIFGPGTHKRTAQFARLAAKARAAMYLRKVSDDEVFEAMAGLDWA